MIEQLEALPIPLLAWYRENARVLPWRSDPTPYHVLVSEIMLQQTRVAAVLDYYRRFLEELPTVADLAAVEEDKLLKLWQGLGYYNRARNLQKAARQIMQLHLSLIHISTLTDRAIVFWVTSSCKVSTPFPVNCGYAHLLP